MRKLLWLLPFLAGCKQTTAEHQLAEPPALPQTQVATPVPVVSARPDSVFTSGDRATAGPLDTLHVGRSLVLRLVPGSKSDFATPTAETQNKEENFYLRAEPANQVRRHGHTLHLTLQSGRQLRLRNNTSAMRGDDNEEADTRYEFRGSLPGRPYWLVDSSWYEGGCLLLVSKKTGRVVAHLRDAALLSPNHQQLLTYHLAILEGDLPSIELLSTTDVATKSLWYRRPHQWQVERAAWLNDHTIALRRVRFDSSFIDTVRHVSYVRLLLPH